VDDMIGRVDLLETADAIDHWKARGIDLSTILYKPEVPPTIAVRNVQAQDHGLDGVLDHHLIELARPALESRAPVEHTLEIHNSNRTTGAMLGSELTRRHGGDGLPDDTIRFHFKGSAGQSFGAFVPRGVTLTLEGDSNDYIGKGLSGGKIIVYPPAESTFVREENILIGNTVLYGATSGEAYFSGVAGERFAVRMSGAHAVVEGVGDHGCEYMTKGVAVILGRTGRNFGAGMSGGVAFVLDVDGDFARQVNLGMVELEELVHAADIELLRELIEKHAAYTGSPRAKRILSDWDTHVSKFVKVMPSEYRIALEKLKDKEAMAGRAAGDELAVSAGKVA
jgi:glutamate synthase (NADPH) large chain